jgi:hypothetical protein
MVMSDDEYVKPGDVTSPRKALQVMQVLRDDGPFGESYAMGFWINADGDKSRVMLFRHNGGEGSPLGNPQSRGLAVWVVLGKCTHKGVIDALEDPQMKEYANTFFGFA